MRLLVGSVEDSIRRGTVKLRRPDESRNVAQSITLLEAIAAHKLDACIGGAGATRRRRAPRSASSRSGTNSVNGTRRTSAPSCGIFTTPACIRGEHVRVFPISNWTELDVWQYIERERLSLPTLYFAHQRAVMRRNGLLVAATAVTPPKPGEAVEEIKVRFRTVGDMTCTCPVESNADTIGGHRR